MINDLFKVVKGMYNFKIVLISAIYLLVCALTQIFYPKFENKLPKFGTNLESYKCVSSLKYMSINRYSNTPINN